MPLRLLRCYVSMLPRLQAEDSLTRVAELQAAHPLIDAGDRRDIIRAWQRTARPPEEQPPQTKEEFFAGFAALGFAIEE